MSKPFRECLVRAEQSTCVEAGSEPVPRDAGAVLEQFRQYLLLVANRELPASLRAKVGASDVAQDALLRACQGIDRVQGASDEDVKRWLRRILLNQIASTARQYHGTEQRDPAREVVLPEGPGGRLAARDETPSEQAMAREQDEALQRALGRLPPGCRRFIELRNHERLSFEEIGRRTGRSAEAARKAWGRAVEALGRLLEAGHGS